MNTWVRLGKPCHKRLVIVGLLLIRGLKGQVHVIKEPGDSEGCDVLRTTRRAVIFDKLLSLLKVSHLTNINRGETREINLPLLFPAWILTGQSQLEARGERIPVICNSRLASQG